MEELQEKLVCLVGEELFTKLNDTIDFKIKKSGIKEQQFMNDIRNNFYHKILFDISLLRSDEYQKTLEKYWYSEKWDTFKNTTKKQEETEDLLATTDRFTCSKCKGNKCMYTEKQIRSADEPTTKFVTCVLCGNKWTFC